MIGMNGLLLIAPAWREDVAHNIRTGYDRPYDVEGLRKDGSTYPLEIQGRNIPYFGKRARVTEFRDISERKKVEALLRDSEERYRTLFEKANDAIMVFDPEGRIIEINDKGCALLGLSREAVLVLEAEDVIPAVKRIIMSAGSAEATSTGISPLETAARHSDGRLIPVEVASTMVSGGGGDRVISVMRDISERKKDEEEKSRLQAQLQQAQKMEAIGALASGVAHDFNNILQVIGGYTQLLMRLETLNDKGRGCTLEIEKAAARASELVKGLMTFSRKVEPEFKAVDLNKEITQAVKVLERTIPRMISINCRLDPDLPLVRADVNQIQQVLMNLGANARDAMPDGGRLGFETACHGPDRMDESADLVGPGPGYALLRVTDTGMGIDQETLKHIFDPFFTTKAVGSGTGLGLSIVYGIIKSHGGRDHLFQRKGQGRGIRNLSQGCNCGKTGR